ncbi:hypothetical protein [Cardinium endosymbiont of Nabis limbatus]|uniref:hypothetical protein n=1 Tax=Cardinium endosymbiont of Nabis limbatus TaxID=3066217 RepID=UPI003AF38712
MLLGGGYIISLNTDTMKMKYKQYSASLLIGLLSFNTLSSCVNTRHVLGGKGDSVKLLSVVPLSDTEKNTKDEIIAQDISQEKKGWTRKQKVVGWTVFGGLFIVGAGTIASLGADPFSADANSTIGLLNSEIGPMSLNNSTGIRKGWVNNLNSALSDQQSLEFLRDPHYYDKKNNIKPNKYVKGAYIKKVAHRMSQKGFNANMLKRWCDKEALDLNMVDSAGKTLLMMLISNYDDLNEKDLFDRVKILLDTGKINVNQMNGGYFTATDYVPAKYHKLKNLLKQYSNQQD